MTKAEIEREEAILAVRLIPSVQSLKLLSDKFFSVADKCKFELDVPDDVAEEAVRLVAANVRAFWGAEAKVTTAKTKLARGDNPEGYAVKITATKVVIAAPALAGVRYATYTLRQLAEPERGVRVAAGYLLPCVQIEDAPVSRFRGVHLCWFPRPETETFEIERSIRLAAYYKFNYVVLESWGVIRFQSHPEFGWTERPVEPGEIKRLVRLARDLGVTMIPQFNIFGHASASRSCTGKHALLDFHPEFASLFEPDGWCWCLSNPETRAFLTDIVRELDDLYDHPPFFHLGCDEARGAASCALCRRADYPKLLLDHLTYFNGILKERNARPMIWHDMFLDARDERWAGYIVCGKKEYADLLKKLPKDFVICDWQYGYPSKDGKEPEWPTTRYFVKSGFDTLVCPWLDTAGTLSLGKLVAEIGNAGMLMTTWHKASGHHYYYEFYFGALAAWNPATKCFSDGCAVDHLALFDAHIRAVDRDMGCTRYEELGSARRQIHGPNYEG